MNRRWILGLSVLVALALLLSGCRSGPTAQEIVDRMREVEASTESAHAVVAFSIQAEGMDAEVAVEMWEKRPDKFRAEVLEASEEGAIGVVSVTDGEQVWLYHPGENQVVVGELSALEGTGMDEAEFLNPRQAIEFMEEGIQRVLDTFDVKLLGEEDLNGVATYKLEFTPKRGGDEEAQLPIPLEAKATVWVEQERWIALQAHFDGGTLGEGWMRVRSLELNADVPDDSFRFEIPEGAEIIDVEDVQPQHLTLDEALAQAEFPLRVPGYVPDEATLIDVFKTEGSFVFHYDHAATSFTVVQGPSPGMEMPPGGETTEVAVRGQTATLIADGLGNSFLTWSEDGIVVIIAGHIEQEEILQVAESLQ